MFQIAIPVIRLRTFDKLRLTCSLSYPGCIRLSARMTRLRLSDWVYTLQVSSRYFYVVRRMRCGEKAIKRRRVESLTFDFQDLSREHSLHAEIFFFGIRPSIMLRSPTISKVSS